MKYNKVQCREENGVVTTMYRGRETGSIHLLAVTEAHGFMNVYDNGEFGELPFTNREVQVGVLTPQGVKFLAGLGINHLPPEPRKMGF